MAHVLNFEKPVVDVISRVDQLQTLAAQDPELAEEVERIQGKAAELARSVYEQLEPMQKVQLSRHPQRPYTMDYVTRLLTDWVELHGDRRYADDASIVGGLGTYHGRSVVVVGHQKGRSTKENVSRNFGMPSPEGYRKAIRLYELADRFGLPVLTFIDTPGAFPGIEAEERGQAEAIGAALEAMASLRVPVITTVTGEGGSGGALALGVGNRVQILEFGFYSVISPEGCAAILWKDGARAPEAAARLKITAPHLLEFGVVDNIVPEPPGGAHRDHDAAARLVDAAISAHLQELSGLSPDALKEARYQRFRKLGSVLQGG